MCEIDTYDWDEPAFTSETWRVARKPHRCSCCDAQILSGVKYLVFTYCVDGRVDVEKCCAACDRDRQAFGKVHHVWVYPASLEPLVDECIANGDPGARRWKAMLARIAARRDAALMVRP